MMRAGVLFVMLLVTVGIMMLIFKTYTAPMLEKGNEGRIQAAQIAGQDEDGMKFKDSFKVEPAEAGGKLTGLTVTSVVAGGPAQKYFGMQANDVIVEINGQRVRDIGDFGLAEAEAQEIFTREQRIVVNRGGQQVTLPDATATATPLSKKTGFLPPAAPSPSVPSGATPSNATSGIQNQLNAIKQQQQQVPTH